MSVFQGIHYRSSFLYDIFNLLKLGVHQHRRYQIAAGFINPKESVLDVCSGTGRLKDFLPAGCAYTGIEMSPEFRAMLQKKSIHSILWNLHEGWTESIPQADLIVMVVSLCQFRNTSAEHLLESFKKAAKRVVIVEEVLARSRTAKSWVYRAVNYLCATDYYKPVDLYTRSEFEQLMQKHGYQYKKVSGRYSIGLYGVK